MITLHQAGQSVKKRFRTIQRIHVESGLIVSGLVIGIQYHARDMEVKAFRTNAPALIHRNGVGDHDGADMPGAQDLKGRVNAGDWYHPISSMRQNSIADRSQDPFCGDGKDCRAHNLCPSKQIALQLDD